MNCLHCKAELPPNRKKWCSDVCSRRLKHSKSFKEDRDKMKLRRKLMLDIAQQFNNNEIRFSRAVAEINRIA